MRAPRNRDLPVEYSGEALVGSGGQRSYAFFSVCRFICLSISRIGRKVVNKFL